MSDIIAKKSIKEHLIEAMEVWGAKYELQYSDYNKNTWTVPILLTQERIEQIVNDCSVRNIRLQYTV